ncbi:hypothetical protein CERSUDRAFT_119765 [Gelatoporia subvermispora B]|uniref:RING-type domain-containing protein n=1 Tax=Ceriporiopsis subvermispora (strain B) TaxID=914234 RepID=M2Q3K3_CERS8|nr:hypothetical protein CERSUDRAFT_119765 [Gelatoporia subvermispora B]
MPELPSVSDSGFDSLPEIQSVSDSSEEVTDWDEEEDDYDESIASDTPEAFGGTDIGEFDAAWVHALLGTSADSLSSSRDVVALLQRLFSSQAGAVDNDPLRAKTLLAGLEVVSEDLIRRYEGIRCGNGDSDVGCSICRDSYIDAISATESEIVICFASLPFHQPAPLVYAFACPGKHLFHGECLAPWLARKTTCPTCRFDIDPDSLTLRSSGPASVETSTRRLWEPPSTISLKEWLDIQEKDEGVIRDDHARDGIDMTTASNKLKTPEMHSPTMRMRTKMKMMTSPRLFSNSLATYLSSHRHPCRPLPPLNQVLHTLVHHQSAECPLCPMICITTFCRLPLHARRPRCNAGPTLTTLICN